ncbi:L,D-transpeptidase domain-containing protein (plasmid) [Rhizobium phaseoli]|uniref:L,D-transpeptidase domain-containing protein n=1 Tax=Rhizobium phaseoli TaxID=396 RepID=A0ABM6CKW0_9HYPH|nr:L,D-transpeptidase domain-containing protein [Rhizobium phaseoli]ANL89006.1 L,D-transpeptidase domain-containing protein [Rhizobium phaseoli]ANL95515.1 L,D-transpeptidase domain-containing protein [Rhizobium phaseoli]
MHTHQHGSGFPKHRWDIDPIGTGQRLRARAARKLVRQKNQRLPEVVKAGPANPLGTRAIYLADGLLRIHGTNDPSSIGTNASSGCFRMYREDVEELYDMVQPGTRVIVQR